MCSPNDSHTRYQATPNPASKPFQFGENYNEIVENDGMESKWKLAIVVRVCV